LKLRIVDSVKKWLLSPPTNFCFSKPYQSNIGELGGVTFEAQRSPPWDGAWIGSDIPGGYELMAAQIFENGTSPVAPYVVEIPKGHIYFHQATVTDSNKNILLDVSDATVPQQNRWNTAQHSISNKPYLPFARRWRGELVVVSSPFANNYYHWLFDTLPRLKSEVCRPSSSLYLHQYRNFQKDSLNLLEIPEQRIVRAEINRHLRADVLLVPSLPQPPLPAPPSVWRPPFASLNSCEFLRAELLPRVHVVEATVSKSQKPRRIFIQRKGTRSISNESDLLSLLSPLGFEPVRLEQLNLQQQISLFSQAEAVIGVHGAGLSNIVFCQPDSQIIELLPTAWALPYYQSICKYVGLRYESLSVESLVQDCIFKDIEAPVVVNLDLLEELLDKTGLG
jgi:capsular polysaccharide biosynthesis protein